MGDVYKPVRLRDARGNLVPKRHAEVFRNRIRLVRYAERFACVADAFRQWRNRPGGEHIEADAIDKHIHAIYRLVSNGCPFEVCHCTNGCPKCNFRGWITEKEAILLGKPALRDES